MKQGQYRNLCYAGVVNYVMYVILRLLFYTTYESDLDIMMQAAIQGVSGVKTAFILYSHIILGCLIKGAAMAVPGINWYYLFLVMTAWVSLVVISYLLFARLGKKMGLTMSIIVVSFAGYECYILPGFMKSACVVGTAGIFLLADTLQRRLPAKKRYFAAGSLLVLCSMMSIGVFVMTAVVGTAGLLLYDGACHAWNFFSWMRKDGKLRKEKKQQLLVFFGVMAAVITALWGMDVAAYRISGQQTAVKYRSAIVRMYGYGMGDYDEAYENEYGLARAQYQALQKGSFGIAGTQTWETLEQLSKERKEISLQTLHAYFKTVPLKLFGYGIFYLFFILLFLLCCAPCKNKRALICTQTGLLLAQFFIMYILHAWQKSWIVFAVIFPVILPFLLALREAPRQEYREVWIYLAVISVILYSKFSSQMVSGVSHENMSERFASLSSEANHMIDLNSYLKTFSAQKNYTRGILTANRVIVSNGAYALLEGCDAFVAAQVPNEQEQYDWIYNPKEVSIWNIPILASE